MFARSRMRGSRLENSTCSSEPTFARLHPLASLAHVHRTRRPHDNAAVHLADPNLGEDDARNRLAVEEVEEEEEDADHYGNED